MYKYDEIDQQIVDERVTQYRDQVRRYLAGELSEDEFRPLRLQNGLYIQRHAPMLRIAVPYGMLSSKQLRNWAILQKNTTKAMAISVRARTCSSTGQNWKIRQTFWLS
jgi:sulfite reductase (NADPH) hemoprotein beta-component